MKKSTKIILYGFLTWLIPFIASFPFVDSKGNYRIDETFFKTIMIVVGALVGTFLLVLYFKKVEKNYLWEGIKVGVVWILINWIIDLMLVFGGLFKMSIVKYFTDIGLRYLIILIFSVGLAIALKSKVKKETEKTINNTSI